jgi:hypothetical protein
MTVFVLIFFWLSYTIICLASCLVVYEFLEKHITTRKQLKKDGSN